MGLADRFSTVEAKPATSADVTCPRYDPVPGTRRCKHYLKGGACSLPDEFMCVEWLKANGHHVPPPLPLSMATPTTTPVVAENPPATPREEHRVPRDLFGRPLPPPEPAPRSPTKVDRDAPARGLPAADVPVFRNLSDEDIASFKALRVEVCLATEACGEVWLVPEYTGNAGRKELSVKDAATLAAICTAFPGARVTSFEKTDKATPDPSP
jgi:hypothetical protein